MSPAIMFCAASRGFHSSHSVLLSANSSFCLIGVLIGVGARDFLCSTVAFGPDIFLFRRTSSGEQNIARSRGRAQQLRVATLGSCNECGARSACSRLQC